jgi:hypothetical protein
MREMNLSSVFGSISESKRMNSQARQQILFCGVSQNASELSVGSFCEAFSFLDDFEISPATM